MPAATARAATAFVRRTSLGANEYHNNFRKVDCETISRLTSEEADRVTSQMCKVYLSLLNAPSEYWEREGVLRFTGEEGGGGRMTAWEQLVSLVRVASATARKALRWMHEEGMIGYFAGKNGVGIRIFLNRASSSIGTRAPGRKILEFSRASSQAVRTSPGEAAFRDSFADLEVLEKDLNPRAPKNGAGQAGDFTISPGTPANVPAEARTTAASTPCMHGYPPGEVQRLVMSELEPALRAAAAQAAVREHERTREWLESRGLPKAVRVAQRETYNVLRQHGLIGTACRPNASTVGARHVAPSTEAGPLSTEGIRELAETCAAMLEVHGQAVEVTLAGLSAESGGILLPDDARRVRELAGSLAAATGGGKSV